MKSVLSLTVARVQPLCRGRRSEMATAEARYECCTHCDKVIEEARTAYWYLTPHVDCCPQCGREERYLAHKIPMGLKERE